MKEFIKSIENHFNEQCLNVLDKALSMSLSPQEITEILYQYLIFKENKTSHENILIKIADFSLEKLIDKINKIKKEVEVFLKNESK